MKIAATIKRQTTMAVTSYPRILDWVSGILLSSAPVRFLVIAGTGGYMVVTRVLED